MRAGTTFKVLGWMLLLTSSLAPAVNGADAPRVTLDDLARITTVSDPQISPDGTSIVCIVSKPDRVKNRFESNLLLIDIATGSQRTLTFERKGLASPRWSPDGAQLAFLARGAGDGDLEQIWLMPMKGGDARRLTDVGTGIQQFAWRPDGQAIAFATSDEPPKKSDEEKHLDAFEVTSHDFLASGEIFPAHLWLITLNDGKAKRITSGSWSLPIAVPPGPPPSPLSWSPDNRSVLITKQKTPIAGDADLSAIAMVDTVTGTVRELTGKSAFEWYGVVSPDGKTVAYEYPHEGDYNNQYEINVVPATGGPPRVLTRGIDRNIVRTLWMPDSRSMIVGGHDGAMVSLWQLPLAGPARKLQLGDISPWWSYWIDMTISAKGAIAFTGTEPYRPRELYYMASVDAKPRRLTSFNYEVASRKQGRLEEIVWKGPDGFTENGIITYPPDFDPKKKYPLVLIIHGGPQSASIRSFHLPSQAFAARDWIVFGPNYRGSDNLGNAYQRAIFNDAGAGPARDVMSGIAELQKRGFIDESRIAVSGWSYGGYMTSWLIGHYDIWKAAVSGAAVNNFVHAYALSDNNRTNAYSFGGSPYDPKFAKAWVEQSPITYAHKVKTPTLILSTTGDTRVPPTQSFELYHALKDNGVEVKFIAYPGGGHFPGDPARSRDLFQRWMDWIAEHFAR